MPDATQPKPAFELGDDGRFAYTAQSDGRNVTIHRRPLQPAPTPDDVPDTTHRPALESADAPEDTPEVVAQLGIEALRTLLLWAEDEKSVTFSLTGPLAQQVKDLSRELSLTPEMFVWHAVKIFIESAPQ